MLKLLQNNDKDFVYADIGAGDRFFTSKLLSITEGSVFAIDNKYINNNSEKDGIICLNDVSLLENTSIDCILMMDVLEHIENESEFLKTVLKKLTKNGKLIVTVPAMQFIFSSHDVFLKHFRRYNRKQILDLLRKNGIKIEKCFYFYNILLLIRCLSFLVEKIFKNKKKISVGIGLWKHDDKSLITRLIVIALNIDFFINKLINKIFIRLPGLSLLVICRKIS